MPSLQICRSYSICLMIFLLLGTSISQKMTYESSFRQDLQTKSFITDVVEYLPIPLSKDNQWVISKFYLSKIDLRSGKILKRIHLQANKYCITENTDNEYFIYILDISNEKLYGFNLKNGKIEKDLRLPEFENNDWLKTVNQLDCFKEGLQIRSKTEKFVFYKDFSDNKISLSSESIKNETSLEDQKDLIELSEKKDSDGTLGFIT